jgi:putative transcription antitermination factor YqgF
VNVLAVDYGSKRVGLAVGSTDAGVAAPFRLLERHGDATLIKDIEAAVNGEHADRVIVGLPLAEDGGHSVQEGIVRAFVTLLEAALGIPVDLVDERLSSREIESHMKAMGGQKAWKASGLDRDTAAATLFLQTYLDRLRKTWKILPYDVNWPEYFVREERRIKSAFGDPAIAIEHIGSTAIPGLAAKPIIDIAVLIAQREDAEKFVPLLAQLGYEFASSSTERHFFRRYGQISYHLSLAYQDAGSFWKRQIVFRDYLRNHEDARKEYEALKCDLISEYPDARQSYCDGKTDFVQKILEQAENEQK